MSTWTRLIRMPLLFLAVAAFAAHSSAQDLEDSLDAELDNLAADEAKEPEAVEDNVDEEVGADEIVVDEGDDESLDEPAAPEPKPETKQAAEPAPAPEKAADEADEFDLEDEEIPMVADEPKPEESEEDLELDVEDAPVLAEEPAAPAPAPSADDLKVEDADLQADGDLLDQPAPEEEQAPQVAEASAPPASNLFDAPNLEFEKRLNRIVKSYDVFSQKDWDELLGSRTPEVYAVQPGDTLWDISNTFFGDGFFWAKLWSQNGVIDNPHKISKGKGIRFLEGTEAEAPAIGIMDNLVASNSNTNVISVNPMNETVNQRPTYREEVEDDITPEEMESGIVLETDELIPAPELPPPSKRVPLLKNLPTSFVEDLPASSAGYDITGFRGAPPIKANEPAIITLNSYAADRRPDSIGTVDEMEFGDQFASVGETILLKLDEPIKGGTVVTFVSLRPRMSGAPGPTIAIEGQGKIIGLISNKKNVYRALITSSVGEIQKGSLVVTEAPPKVKVSRQGSRSEVEVSVIGGEYDPSRKIMGAGALIYLNGGASAGLKVGDILGVRSFSDERKKSRYPNAARAIALIKVADVRAKVATAIVLESQEEIVPGDRTGGEFPEPKPPVRLE